MFTLCNRGTNPATAMKNKYYRIAETATTGNRRDTVWTIRTSRKTALAEVRKAVKRGNTATIKKVSRKDLTPTEMLILMITHKL